MWFLSANRAGSSVAWQRTCFGTLEAVSDVGSAVPSANPSSEKAPIIVRFAIRNHLAPTSTRISLSGADRVDRGRCAAAPHPVDSPLALRTSGAASSASPEEWRDLMRGKVPKARRS
jgi:hypothetical protein